MKANKLHSLKTLRSGVEQYVLGCGVVRLIIPVALGRDNLVHILAITSGNGLIPELKKYPKEPVSYSIMVQLKQATWRGEMVDIIMPMAM